VDVGFERMELIDSGCQYTNNLRVLFGLVCLRSSYFIDSRSNLLEFRWEEGISTCLVYLSLL
jgi:hypothetical protein